MDIIANLSLGFSTAFSLANLFYCFVGVVLGTLVGILPGLGPVATVSTAQSDVPLVMGLVVVTAAIVVVVNVVIEILHGLLNPKARIS